MADESTPVDAPAPEASAPARKAHSTKKTKHKVTKTVRETPRAPARNFESGMPAGALIAVYVVLGLLALGLSFYTGYLVGKNTDGTGPTGNGGNLDGTLEIIEYSDFQCPFCARAVPTVAQIKQTYGDKVTVTYKHFPLESIHPDAFNAAVASECAREQGEEEFWTYHDTLFANQQALDSASLKRYAQQQGLDTADFNACLDGQQTAAKVRADMQEAQARGVQGTPSFWVNGELVVGAQPFSVFQPKIDAALSGAPAPAPAAPEPQQPSAPVDVAAGRYVMGESDAPVEIVEFSDFQCPFCARFYSQTEQQLIDTYVKTGKATFSYRHFPLSFHQNAEISAIASECAGQQGKFWEYHDVLFEKGQGDGTGLNEADLKQYAADLKLDTAKFNTCLADPKTKAIVDKDFQEGQAAGVSGTPSFFVNGQQLVGAQPFSAFQSVIDAELQ